MLNLEPNLFHYKLFISNKQITEDDLCNAIKTFPDFWTKKDLKSCIKKVGFTNQVKLFLRTYPNPLVTKFNNVNDTKDYIVLTETDLDPKYMTPEEYQYNLFNNFGITNMTSIPKIRHKTETLTMCLNVLKRYPSTTQSRILIKYLKQLLKDNQ